MGRRQLTVYAVAAVIRNRWRIGAAVLCCYFVVQLVIQLITADLDDFFAQNASVAALLVIATTLVCWRTLTASRTVSTNVLVAACGLVLGVVLASSPARLDPAMAFVPFAWVGAAVTAGRGQRNQPT